ncbi:MAG: HI0074 family nucleotidyltransferase substrate-binding subunit [Nitrospirota bacterium]
MIDYSAFNKALAQMEKSLTFLNSELSQNNPELCEQFRAAVIQAFEYTYELAIKMIRRQLGQIVANPAQLREMDFMDLVRTAFEAGIVREVPLFKVYREKRNITSHTYNENKADDVLSVIDSFLQDMRFLQNELRRRNCEAD